MHNEKALKSSGEIDLEYNLNSNHKYTLQPPYNTVRYNTVLDITRFKDGFQNV